MGTRSHSVRYFDKYFRYPLSNLHVYDCGEFDQLIGYHSPKMLAEKAEIWQEISAAKFYTTWKKSSKFIYNQQTNNKKDNSTNSNPTEKTAWATTAAAAAKAKVLRLQEVKLTVKILLLLLHVAKEF